jgi:hypothetical protein
MIRWYSTHHDLERKFGLINNNVYAGADGNVYKNESNGSWSKYDNGSWTPVDPSTRAAQACCVPEAESRKTLIACDACC